MDLDWEPDESQWRVHGRKSDFIFALLGYEGCKDITVTVLFRSYHTSPS